MQIGDRVEVNILHPEEWAQGAVPCLNGKTGVIEKIDACFPTERNILVRFDKPANTWWTHQTPWTASWFKSEELLIRVRG